MNVVKHYQEKNEQADQELPETLHKDSRKDSYSSKQPQIQ